MSAGIGFVGVHSGGRADQATSQGELLAARFAADGVRVRSTSSVRSPLLRTAHQAAAVLAWRDVPVVVIDVFSGDSFRFAELTSHLARLRGRRVVLFLHGGALGEFAATRRARVERLLRRADLVLAPSEFLAGTFRPWGYDVHVVPNVVPLGELGSPRPGPARPTLLWMRTFHEHYDPVGAVRTFALVAEQVPGARLTMAGADHGLLGATREEAARLGVADRVALPGFVSGGEKAVALREHDVFLNTNLVDNTPVSLIEAAGAGMVPVATAVGGIPHLVSDDVDAVLVPPSDPPAAARAVVGLLQDADRYARLSGGAVALARRSTWPAVRAAWAAELGFLDPGAFEPPEAVAVPAGGVDR